MSKANINFSIKSATGYLPGMTFGTGGNDLRGTLSLSAELTQEDVEAIRHYGEQCTEAGRRIAQGYDEPLRDAARHLLEFYDGGGFKGDPRESAFYERLRLALEMADNPWKGG